MIVWNSWDIASLLQFRGDYILEHTKYGMWLLYCDKNNYAKLSDLFEMKFSGS